MYTINAFRYDMAPGDAFDIGTPSTDPADWQYFTSRGNGVVQRLAKGSYKMLDEDFAFTSDDPNAP